MVQGVLELLLPHGEGRRAQEEGRGRVHELNRRRGDGRRDEGVHEQERGNDEEHDQTRSRGHRHGQRQAPPPSFRALSHSG